ncbi:MAG TPA: hypothetical protein VG733_14580 [Chthoniobacteraceae bacterium]|nr:hypothetical protein [Chthoniobacteraceae bacterium]
MVKQHKTLALLATLALGVAPLTVKAGTETASTGKETKATTAVVPAEQSNITGDIGFSFVSTYYSRGILQGPQGKAGFDFQPYMDLYFKLYEDDKAAFLNKVQLQLSFWSNIASDTKPAWGGVPATKGLSNWTEFDWMPGISFTLAKNFTLTVSYFEFDYPATGSSPQRSINSTIAYNDSDLLGMWALNPHFTFLQELTGNPTGGHVGLGLAGGNKLGQYYEIGIAPSFTFNKSSKYPLTLTLPVTAGFGSNGFYGTGFGYASAGGNLSVPLAFIPSSFGSWTANAGGTYYYLGKFTSRANNQFSNSSADHDAGVATVGLGLTF